MKQEHHFRSLHRISEADGATRQIYPQQAVITWLSAGYRYGGVRMPLMCPHTITNAE
jgi:hypothetical protein